MVLCLVEEITGRYVDSVETCGGGESFQKELEVSHGAGFKKIIDNGIDVGW